MDVAQPPEKCVAVSGKRYIARLSWDRGAWDVSDGPSQSLVVNAFQNHRSHTERAYLDAAQRSAGNDGGDRLCVCGLQWGLQFFKLVSGPGLVELRIDQCISNVTERNDPGKKEEAAPAQKKLPGLGMQRTRIGEGRHGTFPFAGSAGRAAKGAR